MQIKLLLKDSKLGQSLWNKLNFVNSNGSMILRSIKFCDNKKNISTRFLFNYDSKQAQQSYNLNIVTPHQHKELFMQFDPIDPPLWNSNPGRYLQIW